MREEALSRLSLAARPDPATPPPAELDALAAELDAALAAIREAGRRVTAAQQRIGLLRTALG